MVSCGVHFWRRAGVAIRCLSECCTKDDDARKLCIIFAQHHCVRPHPSQTFDQSPTPPTARSLPIDLTDPVHQTPTLSLHHHRQQNSMVFVRFARVAIALVLAWSTICVVGATGQGRRLVEGPNAGMVCNIERLERHQCCCDGHCCFPMIYTTI